MPPNLTKPETSARWPSAKATASSATICSPQSRSKSMGSIKTDKINRKLISKNIVNIKTISTVENLKTYRPKPGRQTREKATGLQFECPAPPQIRARRERPPVLLRGQPEVQQGLEDPQPEAAHLAHQRAPETIDNPSRSQGSRRWNPRGNAARAPGTRPRCTVTSPGSSGLAPWTPKSIHNMGEITPKKIFKIIRRKYLPKNKILIMIKSVARAEDEYMDKTSKTDESHVILEYA